MASAAVHYDRDNMRSGKRQPYAQGDTALPALPAEALRAAHLRKAHLRQHARPVRVGEGPPERVQRRNRARAPKPQHAQLAYLLAMLYFLGCRFSTSASVKGRPSACSGATAPAPAPRSTPSSPTCSPCSRF